MYKTVENLHSKPCVWEPYCSQSEHNRTLWQNFSHWEFWSLADLDSAPKVGKSTFPSLIHKLVPAHCVLYQFNVAMTVIKIIVVIFALSLCMGHAQLMFWSFVTDLSPSKSNWYIIAPAYPITCVVFFLTK